MISQYVSLLEVTKGLIRLKQLWRQASWKGGIDPDPAMKQSHGFTVDEFLKDLVHAAELN